MKLLLIFLYSFLNSNNPSVAKIDSLAAFIKENKYYSEYAIFIDMSIPSNEKRLFLVNLSSKNVTFSTYVAHGKGSGQGKKANKFSDNAGSLCTALGKYKTGKNYIGKHGDSFELIGLEKSNTNAMSRAIVIHSAWYVSEAFIKQQGRCGNSWGCPAVSEEAFKTLRNYLTQHIIMYIYV